MRFEIDEHRYEGQPLLWGDDIALFSETLEAVGDPQSIAEAWDGLQDLQVGPAVSAALGALRTSPSLALRWLEGWTRDGEEITPESLRGAGYEPLAAALEVIKLHGFFTLSSGVQGAFSTWAASLVTAVQDISEAVQEAGHEESGDDTDSPE